MSAYTKRQELILCLLLTGGRSTAQLLELLAANSFEISEDSLVRDLASLKHTGLVESIDKGPARKHRITTKGRLLAPLSSTRLNDYLSNGREPVMYNHDWMVAVVSTSLFSSDEMNRLDTMQSAFAQFMSAASETVKKRWYQKWLIEFAWKSSAIEGNTYDALETETLLLDHIEATGKTHAEAVMILNHQTAINFVYGHSDSFGQPDIRLFEEVHRLLTDGLGVGSGIRRMGVGISGSVYRPIAIKQQLAEETKTAAELIATQDIWSRALGTILAVSYLQPFEDGNKRTARVLANGFLYANDAIPLVLGSIEPTRYRRACLAFYELGNASLMKEILLESWQRTVDELA